LVGGLREKKKSPFLRDQLGFYSFSGVRHERERSECLMTQGGEGVLADLSKPGTRRNIEGGKKRTGDGFA